TSSPGSMSPTTSTCWNSAATSWKAPRPPSTASTATASPTGCCKQKGRPAAGGAPLQVSLSPSLRLEQQLVDGRHVARPEDRGVLRRLVRLGVLDHEDRHLGPLLELPRG